MLLHAKARTTLLLQALYQPLKLQKKTIKATFLPGMATTIFCNLVKTSPRWKKLVSILSLSFLPDTSWGQTVEGLFEVTGQLTAPFKRHQHFLVRCFQNYSDTKTPCQVCPVRCGRYHKTVKNKWCKPLLCVFQKHIIHYVDHGL